MEPSLGSNLHRLTVSNNACTYVSYAHIMRSIHIQSYTEHVYTSINLMAHICRYFLESLWVGQRKGVHLLGVKETIADHYCRQETLIPLPNSSHSLPSHPFLYQDFSHSLPLKLWTASYSQHGTQVHCTCTWSSCKDLHWPGYIQPHNLIQPY